jgi:hypothetical protein
MLHASNNGNRNRKITKLKMIHQIGKLRSYKKSHEHSYIDSVCFTFFTKFGLKFLNDDSQISTNQFFIPFYIFNLC